MTTALYRARTMALLAESNARFQAAHDAAIFGRPTKDAPKPVTVFKLTLGVTTFTFTVKGEKVHVLRQDAVGDGASEWSKSVMTRAAARLLYRRKVSDGYRASGGPG